MMKKSILSFVSIIFLFTATVANHIYAEKTHQTDASIEFSKNTGPTTPVNPEDPSTPNPTLPPVSGELVILFITPFDFGSGNVLPTKHFYDIVTNPPDIQPNIQIVDLRGNSAGWKLSASISEFKNESAQTTLHGSIIHIYNGRLNSQTSMAFAPTVHTDVQLFPDNEEVRILTADIGKGQGLWVDCLYPLDSGSDAYVQLEVPAGAAMTGRHTAKITWTLSVTP